MTVTAPVRAPLAGPRSEFRRDLSTAPLHAQSSHVVDHLLEQVALASPNVNTTRYNLSLYEVDLDVTPVEVLWRGGTPDLAYYAGLLGDGTVGAFRGVPIPSGAVPALGSDGALAIHRPATGELWELWKATRSSTGQWTASWGGYTPDLPDAAGSYQRGHGVSASGLLMAPGVITIDEARRGVIDHALGLGIPAVVGGRWSYPAVRCDGTGTSTAPHAIHEGQRFRLDPALDVDALTRPGSWSGAARLKLTPIARTIARAAQRYGFIVVDRAGSVAISTESGLATKKTTGTDPWVALRNGVGEYNLLAGFPWEHLQALPFDHGTQGSQW